MKKKLLLILILITSINFYSQILFEQGYYVNNSNQKVECLIKNIDWKSNPTSFKYKLSENAQIKQVTIESIKEFGIYNVSKYIRSKVLIDRSSRNINDISRNRNPIFKEETLFLRVLVEGKASLYFYESGNLRRYFYNKESGNIKQLIYKSYMVLENKIGKNNQFKQQLWKDLGCTSINKGKVEKLRYKDKDLVRLFIAYNECKGSDFSNYIKIKNRRGLFNLTLRPRINSSSLLIENSFSSYRYIDFNSKVGFGFGVESEFILPFNKNKWSLIFEPTYQSFKSKKIIDASNVFGGKLITEVDYNSVEIPVGFRHYLFLNDNSKIFLNFSYVFDLSLKSLTEFKRANNSLYNQIDISKSKGNLAFGTGFKFNDKYSIEIRYQTDRDIFSDYVFWKTNYRTLSVIFGYSIF